MRKLALVAALVAGLVALAVAAAQDAPDAKEKPAPDAPMPEAPPAAEVLPQHQWLRGLAGEWTVVAEATMGPGTEPMRFESTESARMLGDLWLVAEGKMDFGGVPFASMLTIGYDPAKKEFVGTWVDSMQSNLWVYRGELDEARKVLTLSTEGPTFGDPTKTSRYRETIEILGPDHKRFRSSIETEDGEWFTFMSADYRRKK